MFDHLTDNQHPYACHSIRTNMLFCNILVALSLAHVAAAAGGYCFLYPEDNCKGQSSTLNVGGCVSTGNTAKSISCSGEVQLCQYAGCLTCGIASTNKHSGSCQSFSGIVSAKPNGS